VHKEVNTAHQTPERRPLGCSGLSTAPLVLGGNVFGWTCDEARSFDVLDAFVDAGFNMIDTADVYSRWAPGHVGGESETVIGRWLKRRGQRDRVVIATKCGFLTGSHGTAEGGLTRSKIRLSVEASLRRLQVDVIDLYQAHGDDPATPLEETLTAFAELQAEGKIRTFGASQISPERLSESLALSARLGLPGYTTLQPWFNLLERPRFEAGLRDVCLTQTLGVINFFGLARGFLTGKYRSKADLSKSVRGEGVKPYMNDRGYAVLRALDEVGQRLGATPAQVALAWQMAQPGITAPIASATQLSQLQELLGAASLVLDADALAALDQASVSVDG
jgi:aryl-alcohol dehydrogenase-like predicted oxidoreductase